MRSEKITQSEISFKPKFNDKRFIDLDGHVFGRLTVIGFAGRKCGRASWYCRCECEQLVRVLGNALRSGQCVSCGCYADEKSAERLLVHGDNRIHSKHYLYILRNGIIARCCNPAATGYGRYGGRGISVHPEWRASYVAFRDYVLSTIGERPQGCQIDRIDNDGNYEPGNIQWATSRQNTMNRGVTTRLTIDGVTRTAVEWSKVDGASSVFTIRNRRRNGWSHEECVFGKNRASTAVLNVAAKE